MGEIESLTGSSTSHDCALSLDRLGHVDAQNLLCLQETAPRRAAQDCFYGKHCIWFSPPLASQARSI